MNKQYPIMKNPFYVLDVTPREDEHAVLSKATDLKLLFGEDTKDAEDMLLHPGSRLAAEISYLPDAPDDAITRIRAFLDTASKRERAAEDLPLRPDIGDVSPLARLNAAAAFLEDWPVENGAAGAEAAFVTVLRLIRQVTPKNAGDAISLDRSAAGIADISDPTALFAVLDEHEEMILRRIEERCASFSDEEYTSLRFRLTEHFLNPQDPLYRFPYLEKTVEEILGSRSAALKEELKMQVSEAVSSFRQALLIQFPNAVTFTDYQKISVYSKNANIFKPNADKVLKPLRAWSKMTMPDRMICQSKGYMMKEADTLFTEVHNFTVELWNKYRDKADARNITKELLILFPDMTVTTRQLAMNNLHNLGGLYTEADGDIVREIRREIAQKDSGRERFGKTHKESLPLTNAGIVSTVFPLIFGIFGIVINFACVIMGLIGLSDCMRGKRRGIGWAIAGILISPLMFFVSIVFGIEEFPLSYLIISNTVLPALLAGVVLFVRARKKKEKGSEP